VPDPTITRAADALWASYEVGAALPAELFTDLGYEEALAVQADILARRLARGDTQIGWKVGLTSDRARKLVGIDDRPFGHLMQLVANGSTIAADAAVGATIEPELCFTVAERIEGPDVDPASVPARLSTAAAGYELNERRAVVGGDISLLIADNLTNWTIVEGGGAPVTEVADIDATEIVVSLNGDEQFRCVSRDEVDNPYLSIARLAATLHRHGLAIEAGQKIITGAYCRFDVEPGQTWTTDYSGLGRVEITYS
jgi:2-keto-4-pentenoate hydratase